MPSAATLHEVQRQIPVECRSNSPHFHEKAGSVKRQGSLSSRKRASTTSPVFGTTCLETRLRNPCARTEITYAPGAQAKVRGVPTGAGKSAGELWRPWKGSPLLPPYSSVT